MDGINTQVNPIPSIPTHSKSTASSTPDAFPSSVIIIAITANPQLLDPAILRPGRLDQHVYIAPPNEEARLNILSKFTAGMPLDETCELSSLAKSTKGFSGADLQKLCREAAMIAIRKSISAQRITMQDFKNALNTCSASLKGVHIYHP
jgi:transitional endoplasmic reticulum ATPase